MELPQNVLTCIQSIEQAGYPAYAVGGCVRDTYLGQAPKDYDLCTAATPAEIRQIFSAYPQIHNGEKHGTVGIIFPDNTVYEITTFRTEGGYGDSRHPDWVRFVPTVEEDLSRRDFTVNAMAYSPLRGFADPFGGQQDLKNHVLRTVGVPQDRFSEDALRILRGVRFSVTYSLNPTDETLSAMVQLAPLMEQLARERVFDELCKLIIHIEPSHMALFAPILTQILPELAPAVGFQQHNPHHIHDVYTHTAHVLSKLPPNLPLRWAGLLHDIGKPETFSLDEEGCGHFYGHAAVSAQRADEILLRLKAPTALRQQVVTLVQLHMTSLPPEKKVLRRQLHKLGAETLFSLLTLQEADMGSKHSSKENRFSEVRSIIQEILEENACLSLKDLAVNGHDLMALGYCGPQIGVSLNKLLDAVLDERVENSRDALLSYLSNLTQEK